MSKYVTASTATFLVELNLIDLQQAGILFEGMTSGIFSGFSSI